MFGYITASVDKLTEEEKKRYGAVYCGLCRTLKEIHGQKSRLTLNYDMTLLILVLSSLYEPEEQWGNGTCMMHPMKKRAYVTNRFTAYAADLNVLLAWWSCMDDWKDDKNVPRLAYAKLLSREVRRLEQQYPRQANRIRDTLRQLALYEAGENASPDHAAACFGTLMGELFVYDEHDHWSKYLRQMGEGLGRFIYIMDACIDYDEDEKKNRPNPLRNLGAGKRDREGDFQLLSMLMADAVAAFEMLPLEQDLGLMRNILYEGAWQKYNLTYAKKEGKKEKSKEQNT